ncbi:MAG: hypothetical protein CVU97_05895 [Firmicutes bacterium HGW-Firmicutes-21]|nr:MAG: hypothetical protein CVU97_05895 [Firmicutes bacterium HGW-Firmicutes-21]
MDTIDKIFMLIEEKGLTATQVSKEAGLTTGLLTQWKQRKQKPSTEAIVKLATYFNVSTDYLLGKSDQKEMLTTLTGDELDAEIIRLYSELPPNLQEQVLQYARFLASDKDSEDK